MLLNPPIALYSIPSWGGVPPPYIRAGRDPKGAEGRGGGDARKGSARRCAAPQTNCQGGSVTERRDKAGRGQSAGLGRDAEGVCLPIFSLPPTDRPRMFVTLASRVPDLTIRGGGRLTGGRYGMGRAAVSVTIGRPQAMVWRTRRSVKRRHHAAEPAKDAGCRLSVQSHTREPASFAGFRVWHD